MSLPECHPCPACGGAGGGPIGRANSAWDIESYECPRCEGRGFVFENEMAIEAESAPVPRPGIAKTTPAPVVAPARVGRGSSVS